MALTMTQIQMARRKYATQFLNDFEQLTTRVRPYMSTLGEAPRGEYYEFPEVGGTEVREYTGTRVTMTEDDLRFGKRGIRYRKFYNVIPISIDEQMDMMDLDYNFGVVKQKQLAAAARFIDATALGVIKDATTGKWRLKTAADGGFLGGILNDGYKGDGGLTVDPLDLTIASYKKGEGNLIAVDYKTSGTGVAEALAGTFYDRLQYGIRRLEELEVFNGTEKGEICCAISPAIKQMLISLEMAVNKDYGFSKLGNAGTATYNDALNITFVVTNMLPLMDTEKTTGAAVKGARMCAMWLKNQVCFADWRRTEFTLKDVNDKVDVDHKLRVRGACGAGRKDSVSTLILPEVESI